MKRTIDILAAALGLALGSPFLLIIGMAVRMSCGSPVFFCQTRVGREGRSFKLIKFRSMRLVAGTQNESFDAGSDSRVTPIGKTLRKWKLDELPQLWNVLKGDMSLVGPRPEVPKWVEAYPDRWARVLAVRPGITDPASIEFRNEENLLASTPDPEDYYRDVILPRKLDLYEEYVRTRTFWGDVGLLFGTVVAVFRAGDRAAKTER